MSDWVVVDEQLSSAGGGAEPRDVNEAAGAAQGSSSGEVKASDEQAAQGVGENVTASSENAAPGGSSNGGAPRALEPLQQLDVIAIDVSRSMKARSTVDPDMTREDVSKLAFHTMVDKMVCLELEHAVGLVAFGATLQCTAPTRTYESFHTELGRLDARENRTRLFDAIAAGADMLQEYRRSHATEIGGECPMRIFALTDGEDNASEVVPWELTHRLQREGIIVDVMPLACTNRRLQALAAATGGLCVEVRSVEQGVTLFERETIAHVAARATDPATVAVRPVNNADDFEAAVAAILAAAPITEAAAARNVTEARTQRVVPTAAAAAPAPATAPAAAPQSAALRRVLREFGDLQALPTARAFLCEGNAMSWKVLVHGPPATPYEGGAFVISAVFPSQYPFSPVRIRFLTPIYHCNVNADGAICLAILRDQWSPALTMTRVVDCLRNLMREPDPNDPLDSMKAALYREDRVAYDAQARQMTVAHAMPEDRVMDQYGLV